MAASSPAADSVPDMPPLPPPQSSPPPPPSSSDNGGGRPRRLATLTHQRTDYARRHDTGAIRVEVAVDSAIDTTPSHFETAFSTMKSLVAGACVTTGGEPTIRSDSFRNPTVSTDASANSPSL